MDLALPQNSDGALCPASLAQGPLNSLKMVESTTPLRPVILDMTLGINFLEALTRAGLEIVLA